MTDNPLSPEPLPPIVAQPASSADHSATKELFDRIGAELRKIFIGQDELVLGTLVALFSNGHVLIESVPGLGKTLFVRALGKATRLPIRPHPIHRRPDAFRYHRRRSSI